jgi:hypothetical protein
MLLIGNKAGRLTLHAHVAMNRPTLLGLPSFVWKLLLAAAVIAVAIAHRASAADRPCPAPPPPTVVLIPAEPPANSWIFRRSRYTHDPQTGARVAQYAMKPPIEPLDDPRMVTSGYSRTRTVLRGADGSADAYYRVQSYGNGRGGLDAEWERFHDAWRGSTIAGGAYQVYPGYGGYGGFGGYGPYGYGAPGYGGPGYGGPGYGGPGYGGPGVAPGFRGQRPGFGYGPGFGVPDAGLLDPDAADGYREPRRRESDRRFFNGAPPSQDVPTD